MKRLVALLATLAILATGLGTASALTQAPSGSMPQLVVIADGLNNPRHLIFTPWGTLLVAEAGTGGSFCIEGDGGPEGGDTCLGTTGSIAEVSLSGGIVSRVAQMLPSAASPDGLEATGPHDVALDAHGKMYVAMGFGAPPEIRDQVADGGLGFAALFGRVLKRVNPYSGPLMPMADLAAHEATDPDGAGADSNPYSLVTEGKGRVVAVDAGGNTMVRALHGGGVQTVAVFPTQLQANPFAAGQVPAQSVPTAIVRGPDNRYYVGELTGFPFAPGSANVYRVDPATGASEIYATGFSTIVDIAFGPDGSLYVLEISTAGLLSEAPGALWRLPPGGGDKADAEVLIDTLNFPGGVEVTDSGRIFLTVGSVLPGGGQVVELTGS